MYAAPRCPLRTTPQFSLPASRAVPCCARTRALHKLLRSLSPRAFDHPKQGNNICHRSSISCAAQQPAGMTSVHALRETCAAAGQQHLLNEWESLSSAEQQELAAEIQGLDFPFIAKALQASQAAAAAAAANHSSEAVKDVVPLQVCAPL
ncbi:hypothetical protein COO60DRAFT_355193 [Scenedesmus sp. NREL 46B-D3]|nr:hypothetical protein COO60DRAFT_355193 [Scenedesmus sp. NREL 46B-D3]